MPCDFFEVSAGPSPIRGSVELRSSPASSCPRDVRVRLLDVTYADTQAVVVAETWARLKIRSDDAAQCVDFELLAGDLSPRRSYCIDVIAGPGARDDVNRADSRTTVFYPVGLSDRTQMHRIVLSPLG